MQLVSHKFLYEERPTIDPPPPSETKSTKLRRDLEEGGIHTGNPVADSLLGAAVAVSPAHQLTGLRSASTHYDVVATADDEDAAGHPHGASIMKRPSLTKQVSVSSARSSVSSRHSSFSSSDGHDRPTTPTASLGGRSPPPQEGIIPEGDKESGDDDEIEGAGSESEDGEDDEEEEDLLGFSWALFWLGVITVFISILSDAISGTIQDAADSAGISGIFIAAIVLPIVGNAAEHAGAVMFAMKGKLDLSLGVAIGSSTQIALCVLPLSVLAGWVLDKDMDLNFGAFEGNHSAAVCGIRHLRHQGRPLQLAAGRCFDRRILCHQCRLLGAQERQA